MTRMWMLSGGIVFIMVLKAALFKTKFDSLEKIYKGLIVGQNVLNESLITTFPQPTGSKAITVG